MPSPRFVAPSLALSIVFWAGAAAAHPSVRWLTPHPSGDDTAQLQSALAHCSQPQRPCDLRLGAGVFHTDLLLVRGFVGTITGSGQGRTVIQPVLDRPLRSTPLPTFTEPSLEQPYPYLMHFAANSRVAISKLTFEFPAEMRVLPYHLSYAPDPIDNALMAAVTVDGDRYAELKLTQVSFVGADNGSLFGNNLSIAARFEGEVRTAPTGEDVSRRLQHGRFVAVNNRVYRAGIGFLLGTADDVDAFVGTNLVNSHIYGLYTEDLGASNFVATHNNVRVEIDGIAITQTPVRAPAEPSYYLVAQNRISVNENGQPIPDGANDAVVMFDFGGAPETIRADVDIWGNDINIGVTVLQGVAIYSAGGGHVRVVGNRLHGLEPLEQGVRVAASSGVLIAANDMGAIAPPLGDVHLLPDTHDVRVFERDDTVTDEGTNNEVHAVLLPAP